MRELGRVCYAGYDYSVSPGQVVSLNQGPIAIYLANLNPRLYTLLHRYILAHSLGK